MYALICDSNERFDMTPYTISPFATDCFSEIANQFVTATGVSGHHSVTSRIMYIYLVLKRPAFNSRPSHCLCWFMFL